MITAIGYHPTAPKAGSWGIHDTCSDDLIERIPTKGSRTTSCTGGGGIGQIEVERIDLVVERRFLAIDYRLLEGGIAGIWDRRRQGRRYRRSCWICRFTWLETCRCRSGGRGWGLRNHKIQCQKKRQEKRSEHHCRQWRTNDSCKIELRNRSTG